MIRRAVLVAAAVVAVILTPSVAMAYNAPGFTSTVSDSTPAPGAPVTVVITGADGHAPVNLTITSNPASISNEAIQIAGTKSLTKAANKRGVATFTVTLTAAGTYKLVATNAAGAVMSTQTLTVGAAAAAPLPAATRPLRFPGFDGMVFPVGGGVPVVLCAGVFFVARGRRSPHGPA